MHASIRRPRLALLATLLAFAVPAPLAHAQAAPTRPAEATSSVRLGSGAHTYEWVKDWGRLPDGREYGNTHGCIVIDSKGFVYVNTDTETPVLVFSPQGELVRSWGKEFQGGLHGMTLVEENGRELLYLAHTARHEIVKATLEGEVLAAIGYPETAGIYKSADEYHPTSVAVAPNGEVYAADGYGLSWVHEFDKSGKYVRSFGGPGGEPGKFQTPHGIMLDTRGSAPTLLVSDRENHRLQSFDLEGKPLGVVSEGLRRPCHTHQRGNEIVVADLGGRVTILGAKNEVLAQLGDQPDEAKRAQNGVPREQWKDGEFIAPHCARWDAEGNLYVMDWNATGRVSKLRRVR